MEVRFLYFGGCPNSEPTFRLLEEALRAEAPDAELERHEVNSEEEAGRSNFLGSPTIQINGLDIEKKRRGDSPYYGCRIYRTEQGSSGVPTKGMIVDAIREANSGPR
jgi:hypothetical protein